MTLTAISKRLSLPSSSAHNLLSRMVGADVVSVDTDLRYSIGARAVHLGIRIVDGLEVRTVARRHLEELGRETGEDIYLAVRIGHRVTYIERFPGTRPVTVDIRLGQSLFLHATSVGKLFAAHHPQLHSRLVTQPRPQLTPNTLVDLEDLERELERIRAQGYAVSRSEGIAGIVGLAVPVYDARSALVASIHVSALEAQLTSEDEHRILTAAQRAATAIEGELGRRASPEPRRDTLGAPSSA